jgi:hypothetical protein
LIKKRWLWVLIPIALILSVVLLSRGTEPRPVHISLVWTKEIPPHYGAAAQLLSRSVLVEGRCQDKANALIVSPDGKSTFTYPTTEPDGDTICSGDSSLAAGDVLVSVAYTIKGDQAIVAYGRSRLLWEYALPPKYQSTGLARAGSILYSTLGLIGPDGRVTDARAIGLSIPLGELLFQWQLKPVAGVPHPHAINSGAIAVSWQSTGGGLMGVDYYTPQGGLKRSVDVSEGALELPLGGFSPDGAFYATSFSGTCRCLIKYTQAGRVWSYPAGDPGGAVTRVTPTADGGVIATTVWAADTELVAIDKDGKFRWYAILPTVLSTVAVLPNHNVAVFYQTSNKQVKLTMLDGEGHSLALASLKGQWGFNLNMDLLVAGSRVYALIYPYKANNQIGPFTLAAFDIVA